MTPDQYLDKILKAQTFADDAAELKEIRHRRKDIEATLRKHFPESVLSIRWGGSMAKGTMIRESYDGDLTCYFNEDETGAGSTLEEIYNSVAAALSKDYEVERKTSALRVKDRSTKTSKGFAVDLHIDVVPGRYTDDDKDDVYIHQEAGNKARLKTNLQVHIDHIKDSGVIDAIRLTKLWNCQNGIRAKTFVLELLILKLLTKKKSLGLSEQLKHVWTQFRDHADELAVEDPANPAGNDLKPALDAVRASLASVAGTTLSAIDRSGWESVFGKIQEEEAAEDRKAALRAAAAHVATPTRPWCARG
jgi:hypothetical protein